MPTPDLPPSPGTDLVEAYLRQLGLLTMPNHAVRRGRPNELVEHYRNLAELITQRIEMVWSAGHTVGHCPRVQPINQFWVDTDCSPQQALLSQFLDLEVADNIADCEAHGQRWLFVPLGWNFPDFQGRDGGGHSTLLLVDTHLRVCHLFDPNNMTPIPVEHSDSPRGYWIHTIHEILEFRWRQHALIPRYTFSAHGGPTMTGTPLQVAVERPAGDRKRGEGNTVPGGFCSSLVALVYACMRRFDNPNAWGIADDIRNIFHLTCPNRTQREGFRVQLSWWFMRVFRANTWEKLARIVGMEQPDPPMRVCGVWLHRGRQMCPQVPCGDHAYCAYHRHRLLVAPWVDNADPTCKTKIPWNAAQLLPAKSGRYREVTDVDAHDSFADKPTHRKRRR